MQNIKDFFNGMVDYARAVDANNLEHQNEIIVTECLKQGFNLIKNA